MEPKKKPAAKKKLGPSTLGSAAAKKPAAKPAKKIKNPWSDSDEGSPKAAKKPAAKSAAKKVTKNPWSDSEEDSPQASKKVISYFCCVFGNLGGGGHVPKKPFFTFGHPRRALKKGLFGAFWGLTNYEFQLEYSRFSIHLERSE